VKIRTLLAALGAALAALGGIIIGLRVARELRARLGPVDGAGDHWMPAPGDPGAILLELPGDPSPARVELPAGIQAEHVETVSAVPGGEVVVQVKHEARDRRGMLAGGQG